MMRTNQLVEKLRRGEVVLGLANTYPASGIIECMCKGWDFVWIDGQHGQFTTESVLHAVQAAAGVGVEALVRVPGHEYGVVGPYLDTAPAAIMVPMVNNAEEAASVVRAVRFPPLGARSYGGRRLADVYGREGYVERELLVLAQIETPEAVEAADAIIGTEGIDALFFGPDDMKMRLGLPIDTPVLQSAELRGAMQRIAEAAKRAGKFAGGIAWNPELLRLAVDMGYRLVAGGSDVGFIREAAAKQFRELRAELQN